MTDIKEIGRLARLAIGKLSSKAGLALVYEVPLVRLKIA
jgi:hypothetical protein